MAGMRSISLAVDITNYVMLETGQPLHAYDASLLTRPDRGAQGRGRGDSWSPSTTSPARSTPSDLLITDDTGPIGLAGVMGGQSTELRDDHHRRRDRGGATSTRSRSRARCGGTTCPRRRPSGSTAASTPNAAYSAAHLAATAAGRAGRRHAVGRRDRGRRGAGHAGADDRRRTCPRASSACEVPPSGSSQILRDSGCDVAASRRRARLSLVPPTWRPDLRDPYDYVEEVGRKIGFDQLPSIVPPAPVGRGLTASQRARRAIGATLAAAGFVEVLTFPFASADDLDRMGVAGRRPAPRAGSAGQPAGRDVAVPAHDDPAGPVRRRRTQHLARQRRPGAVRGRAACSSPARWCGGPDSRRCRSGRLPAELAAIDAALPRQPRHLAAVLCGPVASGGLAGRRRARGLAGRRSPSPTWPPRRWAPARTPAGRAGALASRAVRGPGGWVARSSATPANCTPA